MLLESGIEFDIAIVDYGIRQQSKEEVAYAKELAQKYGMRCHTIKAPKFENNFEKNARDFRYNYFKKLQSKYNYDNIITAHQLNDQLEWMLMRLTKGAGVSEMISFEEVSYKDNLRIIKPLLNYSKDELLNYLHERSIKYFVDKSNFEQKYERNYFRKHFSDRLIDEFKDGIKKSMEYLHNDKNALTNYRVLYQYKKIHIIQSSTPYTLTIGIDKILKKEGYLLSSSQRDEITTKKSVVIGGLWAVEIIDDRAYIAPYIKHPMPKKFKESCRVAKIPSKIRAYCYKEDIDISAINTL
jgi:tRNA(Ile)-lysidine synthase